MSFTPEPTASLAPPRESESHMHDVLVVLADVNVNISPDSSLNIAGGSSAAASRNAGTAHIYQRLDLPPFLLGQMFPPSSSAPAASSSHQPAPSASNPYGDSGQSVLFHLPPPAVPPLPPSVSGRSYNPAAQDGFAGLRRLRRWEGVMPLLQRPSWVSAGSRDRSERREGGGGGGTRYYASLLSAAGQSRAVQQPPTASSGRAASHSNPSGAEAGEEGAEGGRVGGGEGGEGGTQVLWEELLHRSLSHVSAEAFVSDFVRRAFAAHRQRGNPPASKYAIDNLGVGEEAAEEESCTVCQETIESGAQTLAMPCSHKYHRACLVPWLQEHNTCPVCRCEIESHCARYNQANFTKLQGKLCKETISSNEQQQQRKQQNPAGAAAASARDAFLEGMGVWMPPTVGLERGGARAEAGRGTRALRVNVRLPARTLSMMNAAHTARVQRREAGEAVARREREEAERMEAEGKEEEGAESVLGKRRGEEDQGVGEREAGDARTERMVERASKRTRAERGREEEETETQREAEGPIPAERGGPVSSRTRASAQSVCTPRL